MTALWTLIDEVPNAVLFLLIGFEVLVVHFALCVLPLALVAVPIVLDARLVALGTPFAFDWGRNLSVRNVPFLTWAGVHGGISVALALAVPDLDVRSVLLPATYSVVLFSIVVQGSTIGMVACRTLSLKGRSA